MVYIKFSNRRKRDLFNISLVSIIFILITIILYNLLFISYTFKNNNIIKLVLLIIPTIGFIFGGYQLVTNKFNKEIIGGRVWGALVLVLSLEVMAIICYPVSLVNSSVSLNLSNSYEIFSNYITESSPGTFNYEADCQTQKINNVTYYYDNQDSKQDIKVCDEALDLARIKVDAYFPYKEYPIKVIILDSFEKLGKNSVDNAVGLTTYPDMVIYILNSDTRMEKKRNSRTEANIDTKSTVCHEYVHFVMFREIEEKHIFPSTEVPVWVQEGMAYYIENLNYDGYKTESYVKMKNLKYADKEFSGDNAIEYYIASSVIINHLIKNYGGNRVVNNILVDMENTKDFYKSFYNVVGKTFEEIEDEVLD